MRKLLILGLISLLILPVVAAAMSALTFASARLCAAASES